jgi:ribosomal protein S18 acetylase RimI-like enzyme
MRFPWARSVKASQPGIPPGGRHQYPPLVTGRGAPRTSGSPQRKWVAGRRPGARRPRRPVTQLASGAGDVGQAGTIRPVSARRMLPEELEAAVSVWRAATVARGAPHEAERTDRIRAKLSGAGALAFVALKPEIVGMALTEPGRFDDGEGELDPALLHISMVFVQPAAQGSGVGSSLFLHVLGAARSLGDQRASVWTHSDNTAACRLHEGVGMATTGKAARVFSRTQVQYGCVLQWPKSRW